MSPSLPRAPALIALAAILAMLLAGCSSPSSGSSTTSGSVGSTSGGTGSASAYVKDAPPSNDFKEVHLVFTEVSIHRSASSDNGSVNQTSTNSSTNSTGTATGISTSVDNTTVSASASATMSSNSSSDDAGWIVLFSDSRGVDIDLLNTTGARAAFLGETDLQAGHYQQVRATVSSAYGIHQDGSRENITVSSGTVKSVGSFTVQAGKEDRITIDFDLERSLHHQGNGEWRLSPVIGKTSSATVDDSSSGEDKDQPGQVEDVPESGA